MQWAAVSTNAPAIVSTPARVVASSAQPWRRAPTPSPTSASTMLRMPQQLCIRSPRACGMPRLSGVCRVVPNRYPSPSPVGGLQLTLRRIRLFLWGMGADRLIKRFPAETPTTKWQRLRAPDSPRQLVMWPSASLCIAPSASGSALTVEVLLTPPRPRGPPCWPMSEMRCSSQ